MPEDLDLKKFLELTKIPYKTYFSFGEKLPVIEQGTTDPTGLGYAYETVAAVLGNNLQYTDVLLSNRDDFIQMVRWPKRLPKLPLRDLPWGSVLYIDFVGSNALRSAFDQRRVSRQSQEDIINRYQSTVAACADRQAGQLAMSKGDSFLFAFQQPEQALACAIDIQESLAIKRPIHGPLGPLSVRMAIHSSGPEQGMQKLLEVATQMANRSVEGQILISEEAFKRLPTPPTKRVEFVPLPIQMELNPDEEDSETMELYEANKIVSVMLEPAERQSLFEQDPASRRGGGFQALLVNLQRKVKDDIGLDLTVQDRERIARYAHDYSGGGWQGRLRRIFGRSLGENLGRDAT